MSSGYLLGVDIGTYSSKGVLVRPDGTVFASHVVPHGFDMPRPGHFEQDAEKIWWHDFVVITRQLLQQTQIRPSEILGIGISAIGTCVLPIDDQGQPLRPAILYGIDTRASEEIYYLEKTLGKENILKWGGAPLTSQASGPKVLWIRVHEPHIYEKTRWFLTSEAYLVYKLTGEASIDIYSAGGYAPLYDIHQREWVEEAAKVVAPLNHFPKAYWSYEVVGEVTPQAAKETGLSPGTPVVAGTTDAAAEAISAGVAEIGDLMLMFGSTIFFIMKTARLITSQHFWSSNFLEPGAYAFLGGMSTGGSLTTWFRDQFAQKELDLEQSGLENAYDQLAKLASSSPPGSNGLITLPYFEGERTPLHDPKAKGVWFGLSLKHTRADFYRSLLEGVAFGIRHNFEVMCEEGVLPQRILAVGGGTKNQLWLQIVSDICDIELNVPEVQLGACYGDAFLAGVGVGLFKQLSEIKKWVKIKNRIKPKSSLKKKYDLNYLVFRQLYLQTQSLMHMLSDNHST